MTGTSGCRTAGKDPRSLRVLRWVALYLAVPSLLLLPLVGPPNPPELGGAGGAASAASARRYYAYDAVVDRHGVIAPWYKGQNGQCDWRVRIAAETLKRYPWADGKKAPLAAPEYVWNGTWGISPEGKITVPPLGDWDNGDLGQRAAYVLSGLADYYRYSGDPAAIAHISAQAEVLLAYCQTPADHPWPSFLVSCPTKGKAYRQTDPHGFIQVDIVAEVGLALVRAYELVGNKRWLDAAKHWADLFAEKRSRAPGTPPWPRYANPEDVGWEDQQTGGVVFVVSFLDELIRVGYRGAGDEIVKARDAGRAYLRDALLPRWTVNDVWGRNYWDWNDPVQAENVTEFAARYLIEHPDLFPNWRADARNILTLFINHTSVALESNGDVFSGAWAYPESCGCCGRSLWYGPMELATVYAQLGVAADSEWAREMARRQMILATYDAHETGVVEDNIDGGPIVAGAWFKIAHPMALKHVLGTMAWMPEVLGANRENHILRSTAVVNGVVYGKGRIAYSTYDAPAGTVDVLRLAFQPTTVTADGKPLPRVGQRGNGATGQRGDASMGKRANASTGQRVNGSMGQRGGLAGNGYTVNPLPGGDCIVTIRHDGRRQVVVAGADPQQAADDRKLAFSGEWQTVRAAGDLGGQARVASAAGAGAEFTFTGNQVRVIGCVGPAGGLADVLLDGAKQICGIDCWSPVARHQQVLYYRNGLAPGQHTLQVVVRGEKTPLAEDARVVIDGVQWSAATGDSGYGEGGGPTAAQRLVFGYTGRKDAIDSEGHAWRPGTEFIVRSGAGADSVASWWTERRRHSILGTPDPELYRYGVHAPRFTVYFTVGPGTYHARVKLAETRTLDPRQRAITLTINGKEVVAGLDVVATAGGLNRAADLVYNDLLPQNGVIALEFRGAFGGEAAVQAIEVGPGGGGEGAQPVTVARQPTEPGANLLVNPGFEDGMVRVLGSFGSSGAGFGWRYLFAGPSQSYIFAETDYKIHPEWGLPVVHEGTEAARTHTEGTGHTIVSQDVLVEPETAYLASVWVRAEDHIPPKGFGSHPGDSAGLWIQELDVQGRIVASHPKAAVARACEFTKLEVPFTTGKATMSVRFILDTVLACRYDEGHVTYDECSLSRAR